MSAEYMNQPIVSPRGSSTKVGRLSTSLDLDRLQPFVGVGLGYLYGDELVDESFIAGPEAGLKFFVVPNAFLFAMAEYEFLFDDPDDAEDRFEDGRFVYALGIGVRW